MMPHSALPPLLSKGVQFSCTDCGACCSGAPGRVRVNRKELKAIAEHQEISVEDLQNRFARQEEGEWLLREHANGDCVFFLEGRCAIHAVKPTQCRLYPFWFKNVRSEDAWKKTCNECPGIGQGEWVSPDDILRQVEEDLDSRAL